MALSNTQLRYYDSNLLRLPADKRKDYHAQVDRLITALKKSLSEKKEIRITRVVKAGSFAKHTILRMTNQDPVDVDVVFYIDAPDADHETLQELNDWIYELLIAQYPSKSVEDFQIQRKAATVTFVGTGLSVDVVPVIEDVDRPGYGWQFDLEDGSKIETCAPCQIKFVYDRKQIDGDFRTLVRMAKRWRNHAELEHLKSFTIELIMAYVLDTQGSGGSIDQRFRNFLLYIAQSGLKEKISFSENAAPHGSFADPVVILDPVCSNNNVASRISENERLEIVAAAKDAWETANFASADNDNEVWKEVFGPRFKTEDQ
jgi:tRNA nucleotidyltransferase (CCA-adding enzyme)